MVTSGRAAASLSQEHWLKWNEISAGSGLGEPRPKVKTISTQT